jgi:hypothetical protein
MTELEYLRYSGIPNSSIQVCLNLIDDIDASTGLTAYIDDIRDGKAALLLWDSYGGEFTITDGENGLPSRRRVVLMHERTPLIECTSDGSILENAFASDVIVDAINQTLSELARKDTA